MKNTTPILVLTGLAIVAAVGIAGLTREQWLGQPTPAVATPDSAPAPAEPPAPVAEKASPPAPEAAAGQAAVPQATAQGPAEPPTPVAEQMAAAQPEVQPETQPAPNAAAPAEVPAFDAVRVEKTGEAVIAGRAEAGAQVVVKLNGQEIGQTVANNDGAFVVVPEKPLQAGSGAITLEATGKGDLEPVISEQSVAVIVPEGQPQQALVAVVSPDAPTKVLQKPEAPAEAPKPAEPVAAAEQPAPEPAAEQSAPEPAAEQSAPEPAAEQKPAKLVSIDAVDYDPAGNIVFSGQGEKGNTARVYVDNNFLGDAPVGEDGRWTYSGTADVSKGVHTLRVDGLDGQGNVVNRVEVPFFREDQTKVADATQPAAQPSAPAEAEQPAAPVQPPVQPEAAVSTEVPAPAETPAAVAEQPAQTEEPAASQMAEAPAASQMAEEPAASQMAEAPAAAATEQETTQQAQETVAATAAQEAASPAGPKEGRIVIQPGNNLWRISRVLYGTGNKFTMLYEANKDQIRNPNLIYPGQVFRTPDVAPTAESIDPKRREPLKPDENAAAAE
jgi:nucleoid-associated protein YgaU